MEYLVEFLLLGVGLAMDAFAVSICKGLAMRKVNKKSRMHILTECLYLQNYETRCA